MDYRCYKLETKKFTRKFKAMGIVSGIIGGAVMAVGITSALYCIAGLALIGLGIYLFVDDWEKALGD
jgi:hypothetical protein